MCIIFSTVSGGYKINIIWGYLRQWPDQKLHFHPLGSSEAHPLYGNDVRMKEEIDRSSYPI